MKARDVYFDNAKVILIFLVVLGHFANINRLIPVMGGMHNVIYAFHMPLFIFISGYFSKNINKQRKSEIDKILYIYVVFEILNYLFTYLTSLGTGSPDIFKPTYQNWYILGIFIWRLLIPYFNFYPKRISFLAILLVSIIIGFFDNFNTFLGLYRIIYFMPFFVLGYYWENFMEFKDRMQKYKPLFLIGLILIFATIFLLSYTKPTYNNLFAYAYTPYGGYGSDKQAVIRILGLLSSYIICFFMLFVIPSKRTIVTRFGEQTLNIFLLHMFLVYPINALFHKLNFNDETLLAASF